ncbi:MAG: hypothetical protein HYU36_22880 [Planctomycetes bacterium]|nr:hypothetical protein [Planctomycetota bacterium]
MNGIVGLRDLLVLVSDRNMEAAVSGVLSRPKAIGIRALVVDVRCHAERDAGCRVSGVDFLRTFVGQYRHSLLMFDLEGCGQEEKRANEIEVELERALASSGWSHGAGVIVLDPELEVWVFGDLPHVEAELGWKGRSPSLKCWLLKQGFLAEGASKPGRPKEALEAALREVRKPRSSVLYQSLAGKVSMDRCSDRAFLKFKAILKDWFGEG